MHILRLFTKYIHLKSDGLNINNISYNQKCVYLKNEPLLSDIDTNLNLPELKNILSLEHGESMNVFIKRADDKIISWRTIFIYYF